MTNYQQYSQNILDSYQERYEDYVRYVQEAELNDSMFRKWLQHTLENIVHVFTIIEESYTKDQLKEKYENLLKFLLEIDKETVEKYSTSILK